MSLITGCTRGTGVTEGWGEDVGVKWPRVGWKGSVLLPPDGCSGLGDVLNGPGDGLESPEMGQGGSKDELHPLGRGYVAPSAPRDGSKQLCDGVRMGSATPKGLKWPKRGVKWPQDGSKPSQG